MKKVVVMDLEEYDNLAVKITKNIIEKAKASYGFRLISRDTGKEIEDDFTLSGFFLIPITQVLRSEEEKKE